MLLFAENEPIYCDLWYNDVRFEVDGLFLISYFYYVLYVGFVNDCDNEFNLFFMFYLSLSLLF
jgi:hypothetical protein